MLKEKLQREQELKDIRRMLQTPEGLRFFRRFLDKTMIFRSTFTGNSTGMLYEGKRSVGLEFWADIVESSPEYVMSLLLPDPVISDDNEEK